MLKSSQFNLNGSKILKVNMYAFREKLRGHIGLGLSVCLSVCQSVRDAFWQLGNSRSAYARIFKFHIWHVHENKRTRIFYFLLGSCRSGVMPLFDFVILYSNNLVNKISEEPLKLGG